MYIYIYICLFENTQIKQYKQPILHKVQIQASVSVQRALFELWTPASDGAFPGEFDSRAEMSVRIRKGGFMVEVS